MRWSRMLTPTLRQAPADAEGVSHQLLLRAGLIRQVTAGVWGYLPLGWRVLLKILAIVRQEMSRIGGQEFYLPTFPLAELEPESGPGGSLSQPRRRLTDCQASSLSLDMMSDEAVTTIARQELRSYKQLPQLWYHIPTQFSDEPHLLSGGLRVRQFLMKTAYSFDLDEDGLEKSYEALRLAYSRILTRCGLTSLVVQAASGAGGEAESTRFMILTDAGPDRVALCPSCGYAATPEAATSRLARIQDEEGPPRPEPFPTPGVRTIKDLENMHGGAPAQRQIKTLVYVIDGQLTLLLVRGDHELNEAKLRALTGAIDCRPGQPEEIKMALGAYPGSLGGVGVTVYPIIADLALRGRKNMVTGANRDEVHLRGVEVERDIRVSQWADLRTVTDGEGCPRCDGVLAVRKALTIGHLVKLGTRYSELRRIAVLDRSGRSAPIVMGCSRLDIGRIMASAIEQHHDADGLIWPMAIAPFQVIITPVYVGDQQQSEVAERLYQELTRAGLDVLYDDRPERPGVKFTDADLIGIPLRLTLGSQKLAQGVVELTDRRTRERQDVALDRVIETVQALIQAQF